MTNLRCGHQPTPAELFEFDQKGNFVREIDNIWAIDKGSNMVVRFNPQGRVVWVFGRKQEAADGAGPLGHPDPSLPPVDGNFRQPTDVAWDSQGNTYVTDGYVNSRVAKYDKNGGWVKSWGSKGTGPGQFDFKRMFSIDVPPDPTSRPVNSPTPTGERLKQAIEAPNSLCITPGPTQVLFVGGMRTRSRVPRSVSCTSARRRIGGCRRCSCAEG